MLELQSKVRAWGFAATVCCAKETPQVSSVPPRWKKLSRADRDRSLAAFLNRGLLPPERTLARVEGWILGVPGLIQNSILDRSGIQSDARH